MLHGRRDTLVVLHRPHAGIKVKHLPQRDIQRADATTHRRCQRPFNADPQVAKCSHRVIRQPCIELLLSLFTGENLVPRDLALPAVSFFHGGIEYSNGGLPYVAAGSVPLDVRNDRVIGNDKSPVGKRDLVAHCGQRQAVIRRHSTPPTQVSFSYLSSPASRRIVRTSQVRVTGCGGPESLATRALRSLAKLSKVSLHETGINCAFRNPVTNR